MTLRPAPKTVYKECSAKIIYHSSTHCIYYYKDQKEIINTKLYQLFEFGLAAWYGEPDRIGNYFPGLFHQIHIAPALMSNGTSWFLTWSVMI